MFPGYGHPGKFFSTSAEPRKRGITDPVCANSVFSNGQYTDAFFMRQWPRRHEAHLKSVSMQLNTTTLYPLKSGNNIRFTQTTKRLCFWSDFPANPYLGILMSRKKNVFSSSSVPWNTDLKRCTTGENCSGQLSLGNANSKRLLDTYNEYFSILRF